MAYWKDTWYFSHSNEHELKWAGKHGAKGEKREKKRKATPEQVKKQNQLNKENKVRRKIKANFEQDDHWCCLKYPKGTKVTTEQLNDDFKKFQDKMRYQYKKRGQPFQWIARKEIGKNGGAHIHIIINRIRGEDSDILIRKAWGRKIDFQNLYEAGGYRKLAEYIVKQPDEEIEKQLSFLPVEEQKTYTSYTCSKNLIQPEPERKIYLRWTVKKLLEEGPKPTPGYYIDRDTLYVGVNRFTGLSYMHYTEVKLAPAVRDKGGGG